MTDYPLISVLLCTYNGAPFVRQQIQSILAQTYPNIEIIISDDASTDGTVEELKKISLDNPNIIFNFKSTNEGLEKNIESSFHLSNGAYISFADQDDIWVEEKLEKLYNAIGTYDLVYSDSIFVDKTGNHLNKSLSDFRAMQDISNSLGLGLLNAVSGHTMLATRKIVRDSLPVPRGYYHDWWIAVNAANSNGIKYLNEKLTFYRQHESNLTRNLVTKQKKGRSIEKRYRQYLVDIGWLQNLKNNPSEKNKGFYNKLYMLFKLKENGTFAWPLFFFLLKYQNEIFSLSPKGFISRVFEIRKISRGEKPLRLAG